MCNIIAHADVVVVVPLRNVSSGLVLPVVGFWDKIVLN